MQEEINFLGEEIVRLQKRNYTSFNSQLRLKSISEKEFKQAYNEIENIFTEDIVKKKKTLPKDFTILNFSIVFPEQQDEDKPYIYLEEASEKYVVMLGESAKGNARRIINVIKSFDKIREQILKNISESIKRKEDLELALKQEDVVYIQKLSELEKEVEELKALIKKSSSNHIAI